MRVYGVNDIKPPELKSFIIFMYH